MKIKYFEDTDTLLITFLSHDPVETQDWDENTIVDIDQQGNICSITMEHARARMEDTQPHFEKIAKHSQKSLVVC